MIIGRRLRLYRLEKACLEMTFQYVNYKNSNDMPYLDRTIEIRYVWESIEWEVIKENKRALNFFERIESN